VEEPSKYGVVVMEEAIGKVEHLVEKPKAFVVNVGIYLLEISSPSPEMKPTNSNFMAACKLAGLNLRVTLVGLVFHSLLICGTVLSVRPLASPRRYIVALHLDLHPGALHVRSRTIISTKIL
jgi:hypothetical protein